MPVPTFLKFPGSALGALGIFALLGLGPLTALAQENKICNDTFYVQSVTQYLYEGETAGTLSLKSVSVLKPDLGDLTVLHDSTQYRIVTRFESACQYEKRRVDYRVKLRRKNAVESAFNDNVYVGLHDNVSIAGWPYAATFDLAPGSAESARLRLDNFIAKKTSAPSSRFTVYIAAAVYDSLEANSADVYVTRLSRYFLEAPILADSARLDSSILTPWKKIAFKPKTKGRFKVQFLRAEYDTLASASSPVRKKSKSGLAGAAFSARQSGNAVYLHPGAEYAAKGPAQPLYILNMMGQKVATAHESGYLYQWNGRIGTAPAPAGVYFVQGRGGILGKFFYRPDSDRR